MRKSPDAQCDLCEYAQPINEGESCVCKLRGIVSPDDACGKFRFDPLKMKVSLPKLPDFSALANLAKKDL
ncbi:MAG: hypothetical protein J6Z79_00660 [Clostridia bacterium]|nr:hypothetical protein [Clostridia bacterium]